MNMVLTLYFHVFGDERLSEEVTIQQVSSFSIYVYKYTNNNDSNEYIK